MKEAQLFTKKPVTISAIKWTGDNLAYVIFFTDGRMPLMGGGHDVPIAVCSAEATARRLSRKKYVQGSDGPVRTMVLVKIDGEWYAPCAAINVVEPTRDDEVAQAEIDAKREAVAKAKAAGLTDTDLLALGLRA